MDTEQSTRVISGSSESVALAMVAMPLLMTVAPVVLLVQEREVPLWVWAITLATWGLYFFIVALAPSLYELRLDQQGLTVRIMFKTSRFAWADIEPGGFHLASRKEKGITLIRLIGINFVEGSKEIGPLRDMLRFGYGSHSTFPHMFPLPREELVQLLNEWQRTYG